MLIEIENWPERGHRHPVCLDAKDSRDFGYRYIDIRKYGVPGNISRTKLAQIFDADGEHCALYPCEKAREL